jgi:hypothetical protein
LLRTPPFASGKAQNPSGFATADGSDPKGLSAGLQQPSEKNGLRQIMSSYQTLICANEPAEKRRLSQIWPHFPALVHSRPPTNGGNSNQHISPWVEPCARSGTDLSSIRMMKDHDA